ncbi:MAG TPA: AgmX/PglI C-terminal domain-containing protein [Polyangiaceae bacterium]|jgi:hypothetical protein|nr:AgmX/PglI C-terminal domain-containing protein [Polyangiaceae bacterium]
MCRYLAFLGLLLAACAESSTEPDDPSDVKLGEPSDDIDPEIIGAAVRTNSAHFQMCYEEGRQANPELAGRIEVRFSINPDGTVGQAMAAETSLPTQVTKCVIHAFYKLQLPRQEAAIIAQYPMFFQPS